MRGCEHTAPVAQTKFGPSIAQPLTSHFCAENLVGHTTAVLVEAHNSPDELQLYCLGLLLEVPRDKTRSYL